MSSPIIVEDRIYQLIVKPKCKRTHIGVGIVASSLPGVTSSKNIKVQVSVTMLHAGGKEHFKKQWYLDLAGFHESECLKPDFYSITDLIKDGFIHPEDSSLRFSFSVKKHDFQKRLEHAQDELVCANDTIRKL